MELTILSREKNPFLKREEIRFEIKHASKVPSRKEIREKLISLTNGKAEALTVNKIEHKFGTHDVMGVARLYDSKEALQKTELKNFIGKNFGKPEKNGAEPKSEKK